jgi:hypothetical protein
MILLTAVVLFGIILWGSIFISSVDRYDGFAERSSYLSYEEGRLDAYDDAWQQGRQQGYMETEALAEYESLISQAESYNDGWTYGYNMGRGHGYYDYYGKDYW